MLPVRITANFKFVFAGYWNAPVPIGDWSKKGIWIVSTDSDDDCTFADGCTDYFNCDANQSPWSCGIIRISFARWNYLAGNDGTRRWAANPWTGGAPYFRDFVGTLTHELGHAIGLDHPSACGQTTYVGVMAQTSYDGNTEHRYLRKDDIEGTLAVAGSWRTWSTSYFTSSNGYIWSQGSGMPNYYPDTRFSSLSSSYATATHKLHLAYPYGHDVKRVSYDAATGTWGSSVALDTSAYRRTWNPVAISSDNTGNVVFSAWLARESETVDDKWIRRAISIDGGANWSYAFFTENGFNRSTRRNGISTAYDPVSGLFIASWLDNNNNITFHLAHTSQPPYGTTANIKALDAPGLACSNQATYNCYVTFTTTDDAGPCLAVAVGRVESSPVQGFVVNSVIYSDCNRNTGQTPYLAVGDWDQVGHEAVLAYKPLGYFASDYVVSAMRQYSSWTYGVYLPPAPRISQPSVGYVRGVSGNNIFVSAEVGGTLP